MAITACTLSRIRLLDFHFVWRCGVGLDIRMMHHLTPAFVFRFRFRTVRLLTTLPPLALSLSSDHSLPTATQKFLTMDLIANFILALILCLLALVQPVSAEMTAGDVIALLLGASCHIISCRVAALLYPSPPLPPPPALRPTRFRLFSSSI